MNIGHSSIRTKRLSGALGAEVSGVDLASPHCDNVFPAIHEAFLSNIRYSFFTTKSLILISLYPSRAGSAPLNNM